VFNQSNNRLRNINIKVIITNQVLNTNGQIIELVETATETKPNNGNMHMINHKNQ
jgi:hypothetical protein